MILWTVLVLLSMSIASEASMEVNGTVYDNTYIYDIRQQKLPLIVTCPIDLLLTNVVWTSSVMGILPTSVSIEGATINSTGTSLVFTSFISALSGTYTCSRNGELLGSILLTTDNPSINILSQPVKLYDGAIQFQLTVSSYFIQQGFLQPTSPENITIIIPSYDYSIVLFSATAVSGQDGVYTLIANWTHPTLPNGTTFWISVDNGNGSPTIASFNITKVSLYLTPLPKDIIIPVGDVITIDCSPSDSVISTSITFLPLGNRDSQFVSDTGTYNLSYAMTSDSGDYTCTGIISRNTVAFVNGSIATETVHVRVLSDPVAIEFDGLIVSNVSIINTKASNASLTCLGTNGNRRLQWMTYDDSVNHNLGLAYETLTSGGGAVDVADSQLKIINSDNKTVLIIQNITRYSGSFLSCVSQESGQKALTLLTEENPYITPHPDQEHDAALGQSFNMTFVVGINSNGVQNILEKGSIQLNLTLNSKSIASITYKSNPPFINQYTISITTASEGRYELALGMSTVLLAQASITLSVIMPTLSVISSGPNVLQSTLVNLSCIPSDQRSPVVWDYTDPTSGRLLDVSNLDRTFNIQDNGHSLLFYSLLIPASLQELNLAPLPDPSLKIIQHITQQPSISYLRTQGPLLFRCSLVNGSTEKLFSQQIQLNILRDPVQLVATFVSGSNVTLFNGTTINNSTGQGAIARLDCLTLSGLGTPMLWWRRNGVNQLLQPGLAIENSSFMIFSTSESVSVHMNGSNVLGNYRCILNNQSIATITLTDANQIVTTDDSSVITLPLGSVALLYFDVATFCTDGLNNAAFVPPSKVIVTWEPIQANRAIQISLAQNSSGFPFSPYIVGPTRLVLYINPVQFSSEGEYSVMSGSRNNVAYLDFSITIPTLSVSQSEVTVNLFSTTQISCIPSEDGVQIQWTFQSTGIVLATGYQYTLTVNATSLSDEGVYVCTVFGTDNSSIVEPKTVYVNVISVCSPSYAAGALWKTAYENQTALMPCTDASPKFSRATQMSRKCLPSGEWDVVDFTKCTLQLGVKRPFTVYWSFILNEYPSQFQFSSIFPGNITSVRRIDIPSQFLQIAFVVSADFSDEQLANYSPFRRINTSPNTKRQTLPNSWSYAAIWPSDPCSCRQGPLNYFFLCSGVESSPCNCSVQCQCVPPFVGDGELCTLDSDLDGVPEKPLNCTNYTYCMQDNCPNFYNPPVEGIQSGICNRTSFIGGCQADYDAVWQLQWPSVPSNYTHVQPCPEGGINYVAGKTSRYCSSSGVWGQPDVIECESYQFRYLLQQVSLSSQDIPQSLSIVAALFNYTQPLPISLLPLDLRDSNIIIFTVLNGLNMSLQQDIIPDVQNTVVILDVINNLLNESNLVGWQILQNVDPNAGSSLLLKTSEQYGLYLASAINETSNITLSRSSIVLEASKVAVKPNQADIKFPDSRSVLFFNASFSPSDASIVIPGALLLERAGKSTTIPVVNMIMKNINMFLPTNGPIKKPVESFILSSQVAVEDGGFTSQVLKTNPVSIVLRTMNTANVTLQHKCSFWNFSSISWSSQGMRSVVVNESFVQCYSTHLTSFAVLLAVNNFPDSKALTIVSYIGCGISMLGLLFTIIFFLTLRKQLFEKPHNFIHLNLAISLFLAFLIFIAGVETAKSNEAACKAVAALMQYFWLSAFCWMLCEGVMLYLMLIVVFSALKNKWWFFLLLGYLPPLIFVVIGLAVRSDYYLVRGKDNKTISYCWMSIEKGTIWAFAAPVIIIMLINAVFLIMVLVVIFRKGRRKVSDSKVTKENKNVVVTLLKSAVILLPVLGCTWIFGLLSINQYTLVFTWLFTIFNSLQGLFIFISYVMRHEKVWEKTGKKLSGWVSTSNQSKHGNSKMSSNSHTESKSNEFTDVKSMTLKKNSELQSRESGYDVVLTAIPSKFSDNTKGVISEANISSENSKL